MARYNEVLVGRFNRFVQKHFSMKGQVAVPTVAGDVGMTMSFNSGAENRYLESWDIFGFTFNVTAFAGNFGIAELRNPASSNVVAVIVSARASGVAIDNPNLVVNRNATASQTNLRVAFGLDPRGRPSSTCVPSDSAGVATVVIGGTQQTIMGASQPAQWTHEFLLDQSKEIPLLPGSAIWIQSGIVNQTISASFLWRERFLEESERS